MGQSKRRDETPVLSPRPFHEFFFLYFLFIVAASSSSLADVGVVRRVQPIFVDNRVSMVEEISLGNQNDCITLSWP